MKEFSVLELILRITNGALRVSLKRTASILGYAEQTIRNQLSTGTFVLKPIEPRMKGGRVYFWASDIAQVLEQAKQEANTGKTRGRPSKAKKFSTR